MNSNAAKAIHRSVPLVVAAAALIALTGCGGSSGKPSGSPTAADTPAASGLPLLGGTSADSFTGDPCALLTADDFNAADDGAKVDHSQKSTDTTCNYQIVPTSGSPYPVNVFVDSLFMYGPDSTVKGVVAVSGLGQEAWFGDSFGSNTVGVKTAKFAFRVDVHGTVLGQDQLVTLANAVAGRLG